MAGVVKSVETFVLTLGIGNGSAASPVTDTLTGSQDIDNCVPFATRRVTNDNSLDELESIQTDVWFTSTDTLNIGRDETGMALEAEVSVVEFDDTLCNIYSGTFQLTASAGPDDLTVTKSIGGTVDLSKSFLVFHSLQNSASGARFSSHCIRGRITSTTQVTFDRADASGTADGHWYVVECIGTDFAVTTSDIQLGVAATSNTDTVSVDKDTTLLIGSWTTTSTNYNRNDYNTIDVSLDNDTTITAQRHAADGVIDWHGFAIDFADDTAVEHGTISGQGATAQQDVTLTTPVSSTRSTAVISGNMGTTTTGSFPGAADTDVPDAHVQLTLRDSDAGGDFDQVRVRHDTGGGEANNDISWQVVEWGTGGSPPASRRVMVIS